MENIFYTYIYLDPRKGGLYQYGDYTFDFEPFYVGKGKGKQHLTHLIEARNKNIQLEKVCNRHKHSKIKKILQESLIPIIIKFKEGLSEQEAFELEMTLIKYIGRSDKKLGPLTNHSDGGEGDSGKIWTEEKKNNVKEAMKRPEVIEKLRNRKNRKGQKSTPEHIEKTRQQLIGKKYSGERRQRMSDSHKGKKLSKETIEKLKGRIPPNKGIKFTYSEEERDRLYKNRFSTEAREKMSISGKGRVPWNKGLKYKSTPLSEETKRKISESKKRYHELKRLQQEAI